MSTRPAIATRGKVASQYRQLSLREIAGEKRKGKGKGGGRKGALPSNVLSPRSRRGQAAIAARRERFDQRGEKGGGAAIIDAYLTASLISV